MVVFENGQQCSDKEVVKDFFKSCFDDSRSWEFIFYMLGRLRLCDKWISWIKSFLGSSLVFVLVNKVIL